MKKDLWFKNKTYGWGWTPTNYKGWLVIAVYGLVIIGCATLFQNGFCNLDLFLLSVLLLSVSLIFVCYKKGEKPSWSWGRRK